MLTTLAGAFHKCARHPTAQTHVRTMSVLSLSTENQFASVAHTARKQSFLTQLTVTASPQQEDEQQKERAPMDLIAVLDRSGSMYGTKGEALRNTMHLLVKHMRPKDNLAVVSYSDEVTVDLPLTIMDPAGKELANQALTKMKMTGCTNLSGGLLRGLQLLAERGTQHNNLISSTLLLTDGLANEGITTPSKLVDVTRNVLQTIKNSSTVYTFGFGSDHDPSLLRLLAEAGRGSYYFMQTPDSMSQAFADCIGGLMSTAAQNIQLKITAADGITINKIHTSFNTAAVEDGKVFTVDVGDMFAEERKDVLVDLQLPPTAGEKLGQPLFRADVNFVNVEAGSLDHAFVLGSLSRSASHSADGSASESVDLQLNRMNVARAMQDALQLGAEGKLQDAQVLLETCKARVIASISAHLCKDLLHDLDSVLRDMASYSQFQAAGMQKLNSKFRKHSVQRSSECDPKEGMSYSTRLQQQMRRMY